MAAVELNKKWWEKNKPSSLKKCEVDKCIGDYEKTVVAAASNKWQIDESIGKNFEKTLATTTKAVDADLASAKKAKDKEAEQTLKDIQKDLASKKTAFEKYREITKEGATPATNSGVSGGPPSAALAGPGGAVAVVEQIINAANTGWTIMKDGKATLTSGAKFCQAVPKEIDFRELSGWKTYNGIHSGYYENFFGVNVVEYELVVTFQYLGTSLLSGGWFLNNFSIYVKNASVSWGFSADIDASVSGSPFNSGKPEFPIGAIPLILSISAGGANKKSKSFKYTAHGNGKLESS